MSIKVNKKSLKLIGIIILIIVVLAIGIVLTNIIKEKLAIQQMEKRICEINSAELQEKIIKEIEKNEKINIKTGTFKTTIGTTEMINSDMLDFGMIFFKDANKSINEIDKMVFAFYERNEESTKEYSYIYIPLFKIEANEDGSLKRIIFNAKFDYGYGVEVRNIIENVLKTEYDIDMCGGKYSSKNYKIDAETVKIYPYDNNGELTNRFLAILEGQGRIRFPETPEINEYIKMNAFGPNVVNN